jgi:hypothetical protein
MIFSNLLDCIALAEPRLLRFAQRITNRARSSLMSVTGNHPGTASYKPKETEEDDNPSDLEFDGAYMVQSDVRFLVDSVCPAISLEDKCDHYKVEARPVELLGEGQRGLFAKKNFQPGDTIVPVTGTFVSRHLANQMATEFDKEWEGRTRPPDVPQAEWLFPCGPDRKSWALLMHPQSPAILLNHYQGLAAKPNAHLCFLPNTYKEFTRLEV